MNDRLIEVVYTPDNEPYLGCQGLVQFDNVICACLAESGKVARLTHTIAKSDLQTAACQLIPQAISIALSARELIRQGYLFGALVLTRSLVERATILLYIQHKPAEIEKWNRGWCHDEAPSLAKMFDCLMSDISPALPLKGHQLTALYNSIIHGKPDCAVWSTVELGDGRLGHAPSKILNNPKMCDEICQLCVPWLVCVQCMIKCYFPEFLTTSL
jgi:hypothetical protein